MQFLKLFMLILQISFLFVKNRCFLSQFVVHPFFNSMIRFDCVDKCFDWFLSRTFQVIDNFLCNLNFGFTKIKFSSQIFAILDQLISILSQELCPFILLINSKLLKSKLLVKFMCLKNSVFQKTRLGSKHSISSCSNINQREELSPRLLPLLLSFQSSHLLNFRIHHSFDRICKWNAWWSTHSSFMGFGRWGSLLIRPNRHSTFQH